jgi:Lrp/AsnC family transcriptional regulator, leucine-responsive regulatory protein
VDLDGTDWELLHLLQEDARRSAAEMAALVSLSPTAVKRRIRRLEELGVIAGYTAEVDWARLGWGLEAFTELRFTGTTRPEDMDRTAARLPEALAVFTTAGSHDALVWVRVTDVAHLRGVIAELRASREVVDTRTHIVLASHVKHGWRPEGRPAP